MRVCEHCRRHMCSCHLHLFFHLLASLLLLLCCWCVLGDARLEKQQSGHVGGRSKRFTHTDTQTLPHSLTPLHTHSHSLPHTFTHTHTLSLSLRGKGLVVVVARHTCFEKWCCNRLPLTPGKTSRATHPLEFHRTVCRSALILSVSSCVRRRPWRLACSLRL